MDQENQNNQNQKKESNETIKIKIGDNELEGQPKEFKSGREGYGCYGVIKINGYPYRLSLNLIKM